MDKRLRILVFLLSFLVLYGTLAGCAGLTERPEPPEVSLANINILRGRHAEQRYRLQLRLQNPNDFALPMKGLKYQIYINDEVFARGMSRESVTIPAFREALVDVEGIGIPSTLVDLLLEAENQGNGKIQYRLSGSARLANQPLSIPFEHQGELRLPLPRTKEPERK